MKQTAVEFLLENIEILIKQGNTFNYPIFKYYFIEEAKEMEKQQQGYSEEDMRECWMACLGFNKPEKFNSRVKFEEWFETFKNK